MIVAVAALWAVLLGSANAAVAAPAACAQRGMRVDSAVIAGLVPVGTRAAPRWAAIGPGAAALGQRCFHVTATIPVRQRPDAVAVNPKTNTIYVANHGSTVSVINGHTNSVVATITVASLPNGVAVNPSTNTAYTTGAIDGDVSVIDGKTNTVTATIPLGTRLGRVAVNPNTNTVYVAEILADAVAVINGRTGSLVATIPVNPGPFGVAVNPSTNTVYVTSGNGMMAVINGRT